MVAVPLLNVTTLVAALSQTQTNGNSTLGTSDAPQLGDFLSSDSNTVPLSSLIAGALPPWGSKTVDNSNQYTDTPDTGVTRHYDFTVDYAKLSPDGVEKTMIVINNQFPGPLIEANWGDWIEVTVHNNLDEGTALHWSNHPIPLSILERLTVFNPRHGLLQKTTPWSDGVPGVSQCPITPGETFVYRFQADLYGTSWWHSHYSAQYSSGAFGPLIIHGPKQYTRDIDLGPVILSDWYHRDYKSIVVDVLSKDFNTVLPAAQPDNALINGKNDFNCSLADPGQHCVENAGLSKFYFKQGHNHVLRLINAGSDGVLHFSVDEHEMEVVSIDFVPIRSYKTTVVALGVAQRMDVIIHATGKKNSTYWMRSQISQGDGCTGARHPTSAQALAVIFYDAAPPLAVPTSQPYTFPDPCLDAPISLSEPIYKITPDPKPATTFEFNIGFGQNATDNFVWNVNNSSFVVDFGNPALLAAHNGQTDYPRSWNLYDEYQNKTARFVVINNTPASHPMHLHGHNFFVLAQGPNSSPWKGSVSRPSNPTRRDTQIVGPFSFIVLQIDANNPGVWPFHCHIAWHVSAGLYVQFLEQRNAVMGNKAIKGQVAQTCGKWLEWSKTHVVGQLDSGLKMLRVRERSEFYNMLLKG